MTKKYLYRPPIVFHPGETLAEKLDEMEMGVKELALLICRPERTILDILSGQGTILPDMAFMFESVTKIPANFWLGLQMNYDAFVANEKKAE